MPGGSTRQNSCRLSGFNNPKLNMSRSLTSLFSQLIQDDLKPPDDNSSDVQFFYPTQNGQGSTSSNHSKSYNGGKKVGKISYFNLQGEEPLRGETVGNLIDQAADKFGTNEAVVVCHQNIRKNYLELKHDVDQFAAGLLAIGLQKGDRIGIWSPNNYEWILTQYAAAKAGLILVTVNLAYQARELEFCLKKVGLKAIVSAESYKTQNYYQMISTIMPSLSKCKPGKIENKPAGLENFTHLIMISDENFGGAYKFKDVQNLADNSHYHQLEDLQTKINFDDAANIQFTSGTTGSPKGATLSHHNIVNNGYLVGKKIHYNEKHRICISVPLYHCFGCVLGSLAAVQFGACQVFPAGSFNAQATAEAVQNEKCTSIYGTPTMYIDVLNLPDFEKYDFSSISTGIMAGANCPIEVLNSAMTKLNVHLVTVCYGSTESSPVVTQTDPHDSVERRATTVGTVLPHTEMKIVDADGNTVPCGTPGELWCRGYLVMLGYWDDPEKTKEAVTPDRWYKTGDLAVVDEEGFTKIIGRIKDMIIRGGENIYPREIEEFLLTHPQIVEAYVVGVPDKRLGEETCAWIKLKTGQTLTAEEVKSFCKGKLAHFKIPRHISFVDSFPLTVSGKIQKFIIRDLASKQLGLIQ